MNYSSTFFIVLVVVLPCVIRGQPTVRFKDVTRQLGINPRGGRTKWGGPCVADLDGDGNYDLILSYHNSHPAEIYWGRPGGTFVKGSFIEYGDIHGITVGLRTTNAQTRILSFNKGGGRGADLKPPTVYLVDSGRNFVDITYRFGLGVRGQRGRVTTFMDLSLRSGSERRRTKSGPDLLVVGFSRPASVPQFAFRNNGGFFSLRKPGEFASFGEERVAVADIAGDENLEVINFPEFRIFKLVAPFTLVESTESIFGATNPNTQNYMARTTTAIAEVDLDNNGRFDLYVARSPLIDIIPPSGGAPGLPYSDLLFRRSRRGLIDISASAGVPTDSRSMSVVSGDFDNNGFVDLFVPTFVGRDFFLMNNGDQTFTRINSPIPKQGGVPGGHAVAVDYDEDGRVDLIVGQGTKEVFGGPTRIMRNTLPAAKIGNYLLVRVGIEPKRRATSLHAVVQVRVRGMIMMRRVGGSGTQGGGESYLDTVHFGLGRFGRVDSVSVRWVGGGQERKSRVAANQKVTFGIVI